MPVLLPPHCPTIFRHTHTKYLGRGFRSGLLLCRLLLRHLCSSSGLLLCRLLLLTFRRCLSLGLGRSRSRSAGASPVCMSYEEEDACMSYEEEDTCRASPVCTGARNDSSKALSSSAVPLGSLSSSTSLHAHCKFNARSLPPAHPSTRTHPPPHMTCMHPPPHLKEREGERERAQERRRERVRER